MMSKYCDTSKLVVRKINKSIAKAMVVNYHYSHLWTKCSVALGLFYDTGKQHKFFSGNKEEFIGVCNLYMDYFKILDLPSDYFEFDLR